MKNNLPTKYTIDKEEHKEALSKYHESIISEIRTKWTDIELRDMLTAYIVTGSLVTYQDNKIFEDSVNVLRILISTDSSVIDCLLCDFEDMPLFINDYESTTKDIAKYRLLHRK